MSPQLGSIRTYEEAVAFLEGLGRRGIALGLDRLSRLLDQLDRPQLAYPAIHVAGTNGKGSVAAHLACLLARGRRKVGLYTSPHLLDLRERIRVAGRPIPPEALVRWTAAVAPAAEEEKATYFEALTAIAFGHFADEGVEVAVLEVGMGGRLDATNLGRTAVAVITTVDRDHQAYLGDTLAAVAKEKAGIIKPGCPVVVGSLGQEAREVVEEKAAQEGAEVLAVGEAFRVEGVKTSWDGTRFRLIWSDRKAWNLATPLRGRHQAQNAALAVAVARAFDQAKMDESWAREALGRTIWPARFDLLMSSPAPVVLDVAHNPSGARVLAGAIRDLMGGWKVSLLLGVLAEKAPGEVVHILAPFAERILLVDVVDPVGGRQSDWTTVLRDPPPGVELASYPALAAAWDQASADRDRGRAVVIAGSHFLAAEALRLLGRRGRVDLSLP